MNSQFNRSVEGFWQSQGYGWVLAINNSTVQVFDITQNSCTPNTSYPISQILQNIQVKEYELILKIGITKYTFDRLPALPNLCSKKLGKKIANNPIYNFEVLWNTFNEHYVFFKERNVNWLISYEKYRKKVSKKTTEAQQYTIFRDMLNELDDGHVSIDAPFEIIERARKMNIEDIKLEVPVSKFRNALIAQYIKNPKAHNISKTIWGKINDKVGYVQINAMSGQADYGVDSTMTKKQAKTRYLDKLKSSVNPLTDEIDGVRKTMNSILTDLKDTKHIILDLRFNSGGYDSVAMEILTYFINKEMTLFTKKQRIKDSFGAKQFITARPKNNKYLGKLYILQSHWSASATEILLLGALTQKEIQLIGSCSKGVFSDALEKKLPNGWEFSLSNEIYQDTNEECYEVTGVSPHLELDYPLNEKQWYTKLMTILKESGKDEAIESVLNQIK